MTRYNVNTLLGSYEIRGNHVEMTEGMLLFYADKQLIAAFAKWESWMKVEHLSESKEES